MALEEETLEALRELTDAIRGQTRPAHEQPLQFSKSSNLVLEGAGGGGPSEPIHAVDFFRSGLSPGGGAGFDTFVLIDRDNGGGGYVHTGNGHIEIYAAQGHLVKSKSNDMWEVHMLVVLRINATDADLALVAFNSLHANDTQMSQHTREFSLYPMSLNLAVLNGTLRNVNPSRVLLADTTVNTTAGLDDANGVSVTPQVGDVLIRTERILGNGDAEVEFEVCYRVQKVP